MSRVVERRAGCRGVRVTDSAYNYSVVRKFRKGLSSISNKYIYTYLIVTRCIDTALTLYNQSVIKNVMYDYLSFVL